MIFSRFIGGRTIDSAIKTASDLFKKHKWYPILDYAKEGAITIDDTKQYVDIIKANVDIIDRHLSNIPCAIAIKLSSVISYKPLYHLRQICDHIMKKENKNLRIILDAEHNGLYNKEQKYFNNLINYYNTNRIFKTYQMYRSDAIATLIKDINDMDCFGIKLVRGAYYHQDKGLKGVLFQNIQDTHHNYDKAVHIAMKVIKTCKPQHRLMIATHNDPSISKALASTNIEDIQQKVCFAQLMGMADGLSHDIIKSGHTVYKYIPYGGYSETLPYLGRRLYENLPLISKIITT